MALKNIFNILVDLKIVRSINQPLVTQNDSVVFILEVMDNGVPFDLTDTTTISLAHTRKDGTVVVTPGTKVGNIATFELGTNETAVAGGVIAKAQFYGADGRVSTLSFGYQVGQDPTGADYVPSETEQTLIQVVMADAQAKIDELSAVDVVELSSQLAEKVGGGKKAEMEDLSDEVISAVTGGATVNVLSIPQDGSVTPEKTDFIQYGKNLFFSDKVTLNRFFEGTQTNNTVVLNNYYVASEGEGILLKAGVTYTAYPIRAYTLTNLDGTFNIYVNTGNDLGTAVITPTVDVYLRVSGKMENLSATQVEVGSVATVYEAPNLTIPLLKLDDSANKTSKIIVNKIDDKILVRVPWSDTEDFYTLWQYPNTIQNEGLNMMGVYTIPISAPSTSLSGTLWKTSNDDIAPINGSPNNIGANHGYIYVDKITATGHGKTNFDIGSVWTIGGKNFVIIDVVDANSLLTIQEYTGVPSYPAQPLPTASGTLVHVSGATNTADIVYTAKVYNQLYPSTNKKKLALVIDGKEVSTNGVYMCDKFDLVEKYNVTWIESVIAYVKANGKKATKPKLNDDSISGWFTVTNVFSHGRNGSITVQTGYEFLRDFVNNSYGIVQSMTVGSKAYVPDVGIVSGLDMSTVVTQSTNDLVFTKATWLNAAKPPYRYHQFNTDLSKGMALGYNTRFGVAKPTRRQNDADAGKYQGSTKKMYPNVKIGGNFVAGDFEQAIAFRVPLRKTDVDATDLYWYWIGNDVYLAFDYHVNISKTVLLPSYLAGKKIEQLDVHANTTIQSEFVSSEGIKVKVINNYGYAVLRLYD